MEIKSSAFGDGATIPTKYTYDNLDMSPPLEWSGSPAGTKTFAIICDDPDAPKGTWVHWVIYNIPANRNSLPENVPEIENLKNIAHQGRTDFGTNGYGGPCPPDGTHRYFFRIYALDLELESKPDMTRNEILLAMEGHILDQGKLMGTYPRI